MHAYAMMINALQSRLILVSRFVIIIVAEKTARKTF